MTQQELLRKLVSRTPNILFVKLLSVVPLPWYGDTPLQEVTWGGYTRSPLRVTATSMDALQTYCTINGVAQFNVASGNDSETAAGYAVTIKDDNGTDVVIALVEMPPLFSLPRGWSDLTIAVTCIPYKGPAT